MKCVSTMLAFGVTALLVTGLTAGGAAKDDLKLIQGSWSRELDGKKFEFKIAKDTFTMTFDGNDKKAVFKGKIKIDPTKKPKEMDLTVTEGEKFKGDTAKAIYEIKGDTFRWCASEPGKTERPAAFPDTEGGGEHLYLVLERAK